MDEQLNNKGEGSNQGWDSPMGQGQLDSPVVGHPGDRAGTSTDPESMVRRSLWNFTMVWGGVWRWGAPKEEQAHPLNLRRGLGQGNVPRKRLVHCTWWHPSQVTERRCKPARTQSLKMESVWFCDPMDSSLPSSSVHGILQARTLEWISMPSSRGSSLLRDGTQVCVSCIAGRFLTLGAIGEALENGRKVKSLAWQARTEPAPSRVRRLFTQGPAPAAPSVGELPSLRTFHVGSVRCCFKNKERKKLFKDISCAGVVTWGSRRGLMGAGAQGPPWGYRAGNSGTLSSARTLLGQELGGSSQGKPWETGLSESFWIIFLPYPTVFFSIPVFKIYKYLHTEYTRMHSMCLKISLVSGEWGWTGTVGPFKDLSEIQHISSQFYPKTQFYPKKQ